MAYLWIVVQDLLFVLLLLLLFISLDMVRISLYHLLWQQKRLEQPPHLKLLLCLMQFGFIQFPQFFEFQ